MDPQSFGVFFGNLEDEIPEMEIVAMIISLIFRMTGIQVQENDVSMKHSYPSRCYTANVNLHEPQLQRRTVETLQQLSNHHIPKGLVKIGRALRVNYFHANNSQRSPISLPSKNQTTGNTYLVKNQQMGSETRSLEFKRGGGNILEHYMKNLLSRYVCGFLNSEGGQLMLGVDDEGFVQGVQCDHKTEDSFRIMFDQLIRLFDPPVLPPMYRLEFIPVRDERDRMTDLKVVDITVKAGRSDMLYGTPEGDVYIRRDGSVQGPLRAKDIQAWCHLKSSQENQDKERLLKHQIEILETRLQNVERSQGQGGQTVPIEGPQGQGGQTVPIEGPQGQGGQTEQIETGQIERSQGQGGQTGQIETEQIERSQGQGGHTGQIEEPQGQGGQTGQIETEQIERSQGQGGQTEQKEGQTLNSSGARLSPAASSTAVSSQVELKNSLKRTSSKLCAIL